MLRHLIDVVKGNLFARIHPKDPALEEFVLDEGILQTSLVILLEGGVGGVSVLYRYLYCMRYTERSSPSTERSLVSPRREETVGFVADTPPPFGVREQPLSLFDSNHSNVVAHVDDDRLSADHIDALSNFYCIQ